MKNCSTCRGKGWVRVSAGAVRTIRGLIASYKTLTCIPCRGSGQVK